MADEPATLPYEGEHSEDDIDLFGEYRLLHRIRVEGRDFFVPEDLCVLRACQYIEIKERAVRMPWRDYCWNNTVGCCEMTYKEHANDAEHVGRACRIVVQPGMEIVRLPKGGRSCAIKR